MGPGIVLTSQYNFQYNTSLGWHKRAIQRIVLALPIINLPFLVKKEKKL